MDTSRLKPVSVFPVTVTKMVLNQTHFVTSRLVLVNAKKIHLAALATNVDLDFSIFQAVRSALVIQLVFTTTIQRYAVILMLEKSVLAR